MGDPASTIEFIVRVNRSDELQQRIRTLSPRDWKSLRGVALDAGYDVDYGSFCYACLSERIDYFCSALRLFAGYSHVYKM